MTYELRYSAKAKKQLLKLERSQQERILKALERIRERPHSFVQKVVSTGLSRLRVGDYRIIMEIYQNVLIILVIEVGHRKVIYRPKKEG